MPSLPPPSIVKRARISANGPLMIYHSQDAGELSCPAIAAQDGCPEELEVGVGGCLILMAVIRVG